MLKVSCLSIIRLRAYRRERRRGREERIEGGTGDSWRREGMWDDGGAMGVRLAEG